MQRITLAGSGALSIGTAVYIWAFTQHWYDSVPGVSTTGPLNFHFATDIAFAYLGSGIALMWASLKQDKSFGICGSSWLVLHALFHIWIWIHRGLPIDVIAITNLAGIQIPAFLAFFAALTFQTSEAQT